MERLIYDIYLFALLSYGLFVLLPFFILAGLKKLQKYRIDPTKKVLDLSKLKYEVIGTLTSFIVLFLTIILGVYLYTNDLTLIREEIRNPLLLILSFIAVVLVHDTYFYFTHLLMHKNRFLLKAHMWHHKAHNPTPLSVFSFHPIEAFIHFVFFIFLLYLPIHYTVIFAFYIWMLLCNAFGHMNFEFYSIKILKFKITRDFNTATHHYMHHKYINKNFGIYYNHWDRLFNTNHKDYIKSFIRTRLRARKKLI